MAFQVPDYLRLRTGPFATHDTNGNNGAFEITLGGALFLCIASDGGGWEHVSVSLPGARRCPYWEELCAVKTLFWGEDDWVVQFHPPRAEYVNNAAYCLHLWRPARETFPTPPHVFVGVKDMKNPTKEERKAMKESRWNLKK